MKGWFMFEEDYWLILRESKSVELFFEIFCCLSIMIRDSSESDTVESYFFIIEDLDISLPECTDHSIHISILFVIPIREIDSVRCMNPSKYLCYSYIIYDRTIVEISRNEDYLRIQCIDRIDKFLCMFFPIDIPIVCIGYENDIFPIPSMNSREGDSISDDAREITRIDTDDIQN